ncbi:hypothetical protein VDG1235_3712 [Verrucomicrobiia bacterium DG1235]|nr:hypothetical protein VDG1235_3712 [Verrucomicrobiae bacterium DG1235]
MFGFWVLGGGGLGRGFLGEGGRGGLGLRGGRCFAFLAD